MTQYIRHAALPIEEVIPTIIFTDEKASKKYRFRDKHEVGVSSLRLQTFATAFKNGSMKCVGCGMEPKFFSVDTFARGEQKHKHINLYGIDSDGKDVLFTHDHKLARSLGGADKLVNTQVMCSPCNATKSKEETRVINMIRSEANASPNVLAKAAIIKAAQNPARIDKLEVQLHNWASKFDFETFTRKLDNMLHACGWKRKLLRQYIDEGKVRFDTYTIRP